MNTRFRKRFVDLTKIEDYDEIKAQKRGLEFESLILDIFEYHDMLIRRSYHTEDNRSEQIDGAAEFANQVALIEVKWKESNIAASELYSFCGKIDNKFFGTIGIFISKETLSDNFIGSLSKGRRQNVIVLHGDDIVNIVKTDFPLKNYLIEARKLLSTDNVNYISTKKYLKQYKLKDVNIEQRTKLKTHFKNILQKLVSNKRQNIDGLLIDIESDCSEDEKAFILNYLLKEVKNLDLSIVYMPTIERRQRIFKTINRLLEKDNLVELSWPTFFRELKKNPRNYVRRDLFEKYEICINNLTNTEAKKFDNIVVNAWETFLGDWNTENVLAMITENIWDRLSSSQKKGLFKLFFEIICSSRKENFPQKQLALKMIEQAKNEDGGAIKQEVLDWVKEKIRNEYERYEDSGRIDSIDIKSNSLFFAKSYDEIRKVIGMNTGSWEKTVVKIYRNIYLK